MANFIKDAAANFLGEEASANVGEMLAPLEVNDYHEKPILRFPSDVGDNGRPMIKFVCKPHELDRMMRTIAFPCPNGVSFQDGGSYTTFDVGLIGEVARAFVDKNKGLDVQGALKKSYAMLNNEYKAVGVEGAAIIAARTLGADSIATNIEFANKQIMNPRTNSAFSGNTLRNFQFDFKMIGKSKAEVQTIDAIQRTFREMVYAEKYNKTSSFMLKYPPKWIIRFVDSQENELKYIPKIFSCYLTGVNTVINPSANTFRTDLSPYEIDMSLQFQETKVLTRDEIISLEEDGNRENVHDDAFVELIDQSKEAIGTIQTRLKDNITAAGKKVDDKFTLDLPETKK